MSDAKTPKFLILLALLALAAAVVVAGCGGGGSSSSAETTATEETAPPAEEEAPPAEEEEAGAGESAMLAEGKSIFTANCASCHTLKEAGTSGEVGPNLDELEPDMATVEAQVTNGGGGMPAFKGQLSGKEIKSVATYVSAVAGSE
jgi:mono/diheme cytochrome c family protein